MEKPPLRPIHTMPTTEEVRLELIRQSVKPMDIGKLLLEHPEDTV